MLIFAGIRRCTLAAALIFAAAPALAETWTTTLEGCRVWNNQPMPGETASWSGDCVDGRATGRGVLLWRFPGKDGTIKTQRFEGDMRGGKRHGRGRIDYASSARYEGPWVDDKPQGRGVYVLGNGARYKGEFRDGLMSGRGIKTWRSGNRYEGEFRNGFRHGRGVFIDAKGVNARADGATTSCAAAARAGTPPPAAKPPASSKKTKSAPSPDRSVSGTRQYGQYGDSILFS